VLIGDVDLPTNQSDKCSADVSELLTELTNGWSVVDQTAASNGLEGHGR